jgi:hypothetical protein
MCGCVCCLDAAGPCAQSQRVPNRSFHPPPMRLQSSDQTRHMALVFHDRLQAQSDKLDAFRYVADAVIQSQHLLRLQDDAVSTAAELPLLLCWMVLSCLHPLTFGVTLLQPVGVVCPGGVATVRLSKICGLSHDHCLANCVAALHHKRFERMDCDMLRPKWSGYPGRDVCKVPQDELATQEYVRCMKELFGKGVCHVATNVHV